MKPKQVTFYFVSLCILLRGILKPDFFSPISANMFYKLS